MKRVAEKRNWRRKPTGDPPYFAAKMVREAGPPLSPWDTTGGHYTDHEISGRLGSEESGGETLIEQGGGGDAAFRRNA